MCLKARKCREVGRVCVRGRVKYIDNNGGGHATSE